MTTTANSIGEKIADAALSFVGTPFVHQGRVPGVGLDCVGVGVCAAQAAGVVVRDYRRYGKLPQPGALRRHLRDNCEEVFDQRPGDIVAIRIGRHVRHLGVIVPGDKIVHATDPRGVAIASLESLRERISGSFRLRGAL